MKQKYFKAMLFINLAFFTGIAVNAQEVENIKQLKFNDSEKHTLDKAKQLLKEKLKLSSDDQLVKTKTEIDKIGFTHEKYQQYYKGLKVEFGTYKVHAKNGFIKTMNGELYSTGKIKLSPTLSKEAAFSKAIAHTGAEHYLWEYPEAAKEMDNYKKPEGELLILPGSVIGKRNSRLAYKFDIYATKPISRGYLYIDAHSGEVLFFNAIIKHATSFGHIGTPKNVDKTAKIAALNSMLATGSAQTRYSGTRTIETRLDGSSYTLNDVARKVYTRDALNQAPGNTYPYISNYSEFTDNDNNWTTAEHSTNKDDAALDAHWGAMMTYDYFNSAHNRDSYDGNGAQIRSYVHVDNNYDNAFWNGSVMSYGDGSSNGSEGNGYFDALTSIDVAAHEIGHAVCSFTANLAYQRESGGLNEGFSDIWGAAVEHFAKGNGNDFAPSAEVWLIGDEIDRRTGSAALRSMSDPTSLGQPDTYGGTYWQNPNCGTPTNSNDYCGVHTNSGVLNHWFYLLTQGGSGTNDISSVYSVTGIGMVKAANIAYRTESVYLSANSTFSDARSAAIQSAEDLYGAGSTEVISTTNAWHAVGVGSEFGVISYCSSGSTNVNDEYISRVQLGTIDNSSGAQFYSNFTAISSDLNKGDSYTITVTPTWTGTVYSEGYAVWIDYNQDGDFSDAGEQVWTQAATTATPVSGSFTVPNSATDGPTRMRVSLKYNGIPSSCETFTYGEVEDYTVNLGNGVDTTPPVITVNGNATVNLTLGDTYTELGATATDNVDGNLTGDIVTTGSVNTAVVGVYTITYSVSDTAGNAASANRTVNVNEVPTGSTTILHQGFFESGWDGWSDGGSDCSRYLGTRSWEGSYSIRIRDNSGVASAMTSPTFNLTSYDAVEVEFYFYSSSMENNEDFWLRYYNGSSWATVAVWARGTSFENGSFYSATVTLNASDYNFASNAQFRFQNDASGNNDQIYIDHVTIKGITGDGGSAVNSITAINTPPQTFVSSSENNNLGDIVVYPIPAKTVLNINPSYNLKANYTIIDLTGRTVARGKINNNTVNISQLKMGIYFIELSDEEETFREKFIKN